MHVNALHWHCPVLRSAHQSDPTTPSPSSLCTPSADSHQDSE